MELVVMGSTSKLFLPCFFLSRKHTHSHIHMHLAWEKDLMSSQQESIKSALSNLNIGEFASPHPCAWLYKTFKLIHSLHVIFTLTVFAFSYSKRVGMNAICIQYAVILNWLCISMSARDTAEVYLHLLLLQSRFSNARCIGNTITVLWHCTCISTLSLYNNIEWRELVSKSIQFSPGCTIKSTFRWKIMFNICECLKLLCRSGQSFRSQHIACIP